MTLLVKRRQHGAWKMALATVVVAAAVVKFLFSGSLSNRDAGHGVVETLNQHFMIDQFPSSKSEQDVLNHDRIDEIMNHLASPQSFFMAVQGLYERYGPEIAAFRPVMQQWCRASVSCKFCDVEMEMLYMLIRALRPRKVFEMAPNRGYSSHWILKALQLNQVGHLHSVDIHNQSVAWMEDKELAKRWTFYHGDYQELLKSGELVMKDYEFIFIDALHTIEFSRAYCQTLLANYFVTKAVVAIHDIVADRYGGGRESEEVYKYIAFAQNIQNVFTMSRFGMPSLLYPVDNAVGKINRIRALHGIVRPCEPEGACDSALHDPLYFENGDSPTLFFKLN